MDVLLVKHSSKGLAEDIVVHFDDIWKGTIGSIQSICATSVLILRYSVHDGLCEGDVRSSESVDGLLVVTHPERMLHKV